jgi:hypothetical protein
MNTSGEMIRALVVIGAVAASACACTERSGSEPGGGPDPRQDGSATGATTAAATTAAATTAEPTPLPALWEPIDKDFTGCEGG